MTEVQSLINDGLAVTVGDNPSGQDALLKLADPASPAAMAIATSAALGTVLAVLDGGLIPGHHERRRRRRPDARTRRRRRRRSSAGRRCTSSPTRATPRRRRRGTTSSSSSTRAVAVDVGGGDRVRADPRGRPRARAAQDDVRDRPAVQGRLRPARSPAADDLAGARAGARPAARGARRHRRRRGGDLRRRRRRRRPSPPPPPSPTPSSPTTTPATDRRHLGGNLPSVSGRDSSRNPGRSRPDRRRVPFPGRRAHPGRVWNLCTLARLRRRSPWVGHRGSRLTTPASRRATWYRAIGVGAARAAASRRRPPARKRSTPGAGDRRRGARGWAWCDGVASFRRPPVGHPTPDDDPIDVMLTERRREATLPTA